LPRDPRAWLLDILVACDLLADFTKGKTFDDYAADALGKAPAITATARKLAVLVYRALKGQLVYRDPGADAYDLQQRTRILRRLRQRAATLGFALVNRDTGEILEAVPA
jgi:hypothetical protein